MIDECHVNLQIKLFPNLWTNTHKNKTVSVKCQ